MTYSKRTTAPSEENKYYRHVNYGGLNSCIHIKNGSCLPNCVGYAWGRFYELTGIKPKLSRGNAENWYGYKDGYKRGTTPKLGAVICWRKGKTGNSSDGAGHVAIVEEIYSDGSILTSNSGYSGNRFFMKKVTPPYYKEVGSAYTFQGFIYNPNEYDTDPKPSSSFFPPRGYFKLGDKHKNVAKVAEFMRKTFPAYTPKEALGDYYGKYIEASIKEFQRRAKADGRYNDNIDGCLGKKTLKALESYGFKH